MIARPLPIPEEGPNPKLGSRSGRAAVARRRGLRKRARYRMLVRIVVTVSVVTLLVGVYLAGMANVTRMNYELGKNVQRESALAEDSARLDDEIERLSSRERLAGLAQKMGLHESQNFAQVTLPAPQHGSPKVTGIAFLPWLK